VRPTRGRLSFGLDVATTGEWSDIRRLMELAVAAEGSGWDGFFLWDIFLPEDEAEAVADPWIALAAIAVATSRLRIGALVAPLPRHQPWDLARRLVALDHLSNGRVIFGAGLGWRANELQRLGLPSDLPSRVERLEEGVEIIDRLWTGEEVTFEGRHHRLTSVRSLPTPVQRPRIPIWLAAGWPRTAPLRRATRWDGVYLMTEHQATGEQLSAADVRAASELVSRERPGGRGFDVVANVFTLEDDDRGAAATAAMADAGATWTLELTPETFVEHLQLVRRGPPVSSVQGS
jgi:alkanesulfonate monooxygenase SsuD/methylene tetrahydromethanopterin reductase-like flavin-dependent oxidoreductase (luciferase family)